MSDRKRRYSFYRLISTNVWLTILILGFLGILLLVISAILPEGGVWAVITRNLAYVILTSGIASFIGAYLARQEIYTYLTEQYELLSRVHDAGINSIETFPINIPEGTTQVDILVIRAHRWMDENIQDIRRVISEDPCKIRICFVHPDSQMIPILSNKFTEEQEKVREKILDSVKKIVEVSEEFRDDNDQKRVRVYGHNLVPSHTYYKFDGVVHVVWYPMGRGYMKDLPVIKLDEEGELYKFFSKQFEEIWEESDTELLYDNHQSIDKNKKIFDSLSVETNDLFGE